MLGSLPVIGVVFQWIGHLTCQVLSLPADVLVGAAKATCVGVFGAVCP